MSDAFSNETPISYSRMLASWLSTQPGAFYSKPGGVEMDAFDLAYTACPIGFRGSDRPTQLAHFKAVLHIVGYDARMNGDRWQLALPGNTETKADDED